jgi:mediator of RNA polymerase II transcription subunit 12, fungi type
VEREGQLCVSVTPISTICVLTDSSCPRIRLATHIFSDQLLDREQYLEWVVSSLENTTHGKLPVWLLLLQIYWRDLLSVRKMGSRLITALLSHLRAIQMNPDKDLLQPLLTKISALLVGLLKSHEPSFVQPLGWQKYAAAIKKIGTTDTSVRTTILKLESRNHRLLGSEPNAQTSPRHAMLSLLDANHMSSPNELSAKLLSLSADKNALANTLLEWCASSYRPGPTKTYIAAQLLRIWSVLRFDATAATLDFVSAESGNNLDRDVVYALTTDLIRSGHFSVPRYFQWLIARGGITDSHEMDVDGPCATRLLVELPVDALTESQRYVRAGMLRRVSYPMDEHERDAEAAVQLLKGILESLAVLPGPANPHKRLHRFLKLIRRSSHGLKTLIGVWVRHNLGLPEDKVAGHGAQELPFPGPLFHAIRSVLEACEDHRMLAETISVVTQVSNVDVLASCADTVHRHLPTFSAMGVTEELFEDLLTRLKSVAEVQGLLARPLLASLASLAARIPKRDDLAAQLAKDLAQSDRNIGIDACSPVSDNMTATANDSGDVYEAIEKRLTNGSSLDKNTMDRMFATIVSQLRSSWDGVIDHRRACSVLLRLRIFDNQHFDQLMVGWIRSLRIDASSGPVLAILPALVAAGCLSMSTVLIAAMSETAPSAAGVAAPLPTTTLLQILQSSHQSRFIQEILAILVARPTPTEVIQAEDAYRLCVLQDEVAHQHGNELLTLVRFALTEYAFCRSQGLLDGLPLDGTKLQRALVGRLTLLVLKDANAVSKALAARLQDPGAMQLLDSLVTRMLLPSSDSKAATIPTPLSFSQILSIADDFTLPFCQLKLFLSLHSGDASSGTSVNSPAAERSQSAMEQFVRAMDDAIDAHNTAWTGLLPMLGPELAHHLRLRTQSRLLALMPSGREALPDGQSQESLTQQVETARDLLTVIETMTRGAASARPLQLVPAIVDKLADLWELLATASSTPASEAHFRTRASLVNDWLPLLLDFVLLHLPTTQQVTPQPQQQDASRQVNEVRARCVIVLLGLMQEVDAESSSFKTSPVYISPGIQHPNPTIATSSPPAERIFDILCVMVDGLSDDARLQCVRAVKESSSDARLRYLLSFSGGGREDRLMLAKRERPVLGARQPTGTAATSAPGMATPATTNAAAGAGDASAPSSTPPTPLTTAPGMAMGTGMGMPAGRMQPPQPLPEKLMPFVFRRWEILNEPTPNVGENDTSLNLQLFEARKIR